MCSPTQSTQANAGLDQPTRSLPRIGEKAVDFTAMTTHGELKFAEK